MSQIERLIEAVNKFREDRNWRQFHNPKDLALGLVLEAGEVLEHFHWKNGTEITDYLLSEKSKEVSNELADVLIYLLYMASDFGVDLEQAVLQKLEEQAKKYPVEKSYGIAKKYTEL